MNTLLIIGILITAGFTFGELVEKLGLPRVTGYILAGVLLNPGIFHFIPL
ncbi:TPA: cation:proton antiporter, partial [Candidatus Acetothermia bacterium]|nr:cation:proton antiporter [Candidatus Acetothermia bacterium]